MQMVTIFLLFKSVVICQEAIFSDLLPQKQLDPPILHIMDRE